MLASSGPRFTTGREADGSAAQHQIMLHQLLAASFRGESNLPSGLQIQDEYYSLLSCPQVILTAIT